MTYGYTDTSGNVGDPVSRIVTVVDTTPATLTMSGQVEMQHPAHEPFIDPGVTFSDGVDGEGSVVASERWILINLVHISLLILMWIPRGIPPIFLHALYMLLIKLPGYHSRG